MKFRDLIKGIARHPVKASGYIFSSFSMMFTVIKMITHFFPDIKIDGPYPLIAIAAVSIGIGLKKVWKPSNVKIKVARSDTTIEISFADLFSQSGLRVIAVNDFFDSKIGSPVSEKSLHGQLLQKCFGGSPLPFDSQLDDQLNDYQIIEACPGKDGKQNRYERGSTAVVLANSDKYLLFALTTTSAADCKASCDVTHMWYALHCMWQRARSECGGHDVNVPLIGSGLAGLGLPTRDLLNVIILSAITETKAKEICKTIRVVLHDSRFEDIDLRDVKSFWEDK